MDYSELILPTFNVDMAKFQSLRKQVRKRMDLILEAPYARSQALGKGKWEDFTGLRSAHMQGGKFVFIIAICEECIANQYIEANRKYCGAECKGEPEKRVVFIAFNTHDVAYGKL